MSKWLYIISISFQTSRALLLMIYSLSAKRVKVIKKFINKNNVYKDFYGSIIYN